MKGMDIKGEFTKEMPTLHAKECMEQCKEDNRCLAWVYDESKCFLKEKPEGKNPRQGTVSGFVREKYKCKMGRDK